MSLLRPGPCRAGPRCRHHPCPEPWSSGTRESVLRLRPPSTASGPRPPSSLSCFPPAGGWRSPPSGSSERGASSPFPSVPQPQPTAMTPSPLLRPLRGRGEDTGCRPLARQPLRCGTQRPPGINPRGTCFCSQPGTPAPGVWICHRVSLRPLTVAPPPRPRGLLARGQGTASRCRPEGRRPRGPRARPCVCPGPGPLGPASAASLLGPRGPRPPLPRCVLGERSQSTCPITCHVCWPQSTGLWSPAPGPCPPPPVPSPLVPPPPRSPRPSV